MVLRILLDTCQTEGENMQKIIRKIIKFALSNSIIPVTYIFKGDLRSKLQLCFYDTLFLENNQKSNQICSHKGKPQKLKCVATIKSELSYHARVV